MRISIRDCRIEDIDEVISLLKASDLFFRRDTKENYEEKINKCPGQIIVAVDDESAGKIVGVVQINFDGWLSMLSHLAVAEDYRKKGIGGKLVKAVEKRLSDFGSDSCVLFVWETSPHLIDWYTKMGYEDVGCCHTLVKPSFKNPDMKKDDGIPEKINKIGNATFSIDKETLDSFKKHCRMNDLNPSDLVNDFMASSVGKEPRNTEYDLSTKRKIFKN